MDIVKYIIGVIVLLLLVHGVNASPQSDEFNSGSLETGLWHWVREDSSAWIAGSSYIQINCTNTDMDASIQTAPLLLQNTTNINQTISTKISSNPDDIYEGGGLLFYADDDNYISVQYYNTSTTSRVIIKKEDNNVLSYEYNDTELMSPTYLRINKTENDYTGYYSVDGITWMAVGVTYTISDIMIDVGITSYGAPSTDPEPFLFDYFRVEYNILPKSDEFNTGSLNTSLWHWLRQNASAWNTESTYLQFNSTNTDMWFSIQTAPLLLQNTNNVNQSITTQLSATPSANYEGGGPIFYADDDNWVNLIYYYSGGSRYVLVKKEDDDVTVYNATLISAIDPIYLNLTKSGDLYSSYYSTTGNDNSWIEIGNVQTLPDTINNIGLTVHSGDSIYPRPFEFDWFRTSLDVTNFIPASPTNLTRISEVNAINWSWSLLSGNNVDLFNLTFINESSSFSTTTPNMWYVHNVGYYNQSCIEVQSWNSTGTGLPSSNVISSCAYSLSIVEMPKMTISLILWNYGINYTWSDNINYTSFEGYFYED